MECDLTKATILQTFDDDAQAISYVRMKAHPLLEDAKDVPIPRFGITYLYML